MGKNTLKSPHKIDNFQQCAASGPITGESSAPVCPWLRLARCWIASRLMIFGLFVGYRESVDNLMKETLAKNVRVKRMITIHSRHALWSSNAVNLHRRHSATYQMGASSPSIQSFHAAPNMLWLYSPFSFVSQSPSQYYCMQLVKI